MGLTSQQQKLTGFQLSKRRFALMVAIPILTYMIVWTIFPYAWVLLLSVFEYSPRRAGTGFLGLGGDNPFVGLKHFANMFDYLDPVPRQVLLFRTAFKNTILFTAIIVPINLAITIPLAVMVNNIKHQRLTRVYRTIIFTPVITSSVGVGIMWGYIFNPQRGILNAFLSEIAGRRLAISWLRDANLDVAGIPVALIAVMIAYLWMDIGYNFIIFLAGLQNIPISVMEATELDGASPVQKMFRIIIPLLAPQILLTSILTMISAFQVYDLVQVMTAGGPNNLTRVIILDIFVNAFRHESMGWAAAVSIVLFLVVLGISLVQRRVLRYDWEY